MLKRIKRYFETRRMLKEYSVLLNNYHYYLKEGLFHEAIGYLDKAVALEIKLENLVKNRKVLDKKEQEILSIRNPKFKTI